MQSQLFSARMQLTRRNSIMVLPPRVMVDYWHGYVWGNAAQVGGISPGGRCYPTPLLRHMGLVYDRWIINELKCTLSNRTERFSIFKCMICLWIQAIRLPKYILKLDIFDFLALSLPKRQCYFLWVCMHRYEYCQPSYLFCTESWRCIQDIK